ncbi:protein SEEDLING PLASTID DEVELOPMENT 1-like [Zingiber officinale]|uniref:protein SEEDLING PLASTID DEVELOPMENT 1-like n=1 Tax=Zingiber officinale TaxID=94328 RepID=UPI001C4CCE0D|nr:protein SEEDLING PLASTID DEVELOPMENT 1-like [Zingiber officinale]
MLPLPQSPRVSSATARTLDGISLRRFYGPPFSLRLRRPSLPPFPRVLSLLRRRLRLPTSISSLPCGDAVDDSFDEELRRLLVLLPLEMRRRVEAHPELRRLVEIVMDLGRRPIARFPSGDFFLAEFPISSQELHHAISQMGAFASDNRAGISRTLHRISAIRNRKGDIIGLTCRVGRAVAGSANLLRDLVKDGGSLLLIGPPGVGKTTIIREIARMLADDYKKRVMIVDTSNEIGGDGDIPHAGIGSARRLQVPDPNMQHKVLIEAVENHMPQVIVIDEIGTKLEAIAASTIAQRGIQLVATAHGVTIENLIMNPSLEMLVGGIHSVTLGDEEASRRGIQKTVLERKGPSTFSCAAEIVSKIEVRVHHSLEATVDALLAGRPPNFDIRRMDTEDFTTETLLSQTKHFCDISSQKEDETKDENNYVIPCEEFSSDASSVQLKKKQIDIYQEVERDFRLFIYGITEASVMEAIKHLGIDEMIKITDNLSEADAFIAWYAKLKKNSHIQAVAKSSGIPVFVTKSTSLAQLTKAIRALVNEHANLLKTEKESSSSEMVDALEEARLAIEKIVIPQDKSVQLLPRPPHIISGQIGLIKKYKLKWETVGEHPMVYLRILPLQSGIGGKHVDANGGSSELEDLDCFDSIDISQHGIARLPLLPE